MSQMGRGITFIEKRIFGIQRKMVAYMTQKSWNEMELYHYRICSTLWKALRRRI